MKGIPWDAPSYDIFLLQIISFTVLDFSVQHARDCSQDGLVYYDGIDSNATHSIYCGYYISQLPRSSNNMAILDFFSDGSDSRRGFIIGYEAIDDSNVEDSAPSLAMGK